MKYWLNYFKYKNIFLNSFFLISRTLNCLWLVYTLIKYGNGDCLNITTLIDSDNPNDPEIISEIENKDKIKVEGENKGVYDWLCDHKVQIIIGTIIVIIIVIWFNYPTNSVNMTDIQYPVEDTWNKWIIKPLYMNHQILWWGDYMPDLTKLPEGIKYENLNIRESGKDIIICFKKIEPLIIDGDIID